MVLNARRGTGRAIHSYPGYQDFSNSEKEHNDDEFLEARQEKHWPGA